MQMWCQLGVFCFVCQVCGFSVSLHIYIFFIYLFWSQKEPSWTRRTDRASLRLPFLQNADLHIPQWFTPHSRYSSIERCDFCAVKGHFEQLSWTKSLIFEMVVK